MTEVTDGRGSPVAQADGERNRWWLVAAAGLAVYMASVDMSIVNVALPAIEQDFEIATSVTEWIVLAYLLPLAGLALPSGRWLAGVGGTLDLATRRRGCWRPLVPRPALPAR